MYKFNAKTATAALLSLCSMVLVSPDAAAEPAGDGHAATAHKVSAHAATAHNGSAHSFSGHAHWYGEPFHGRRTASGRIYDMHKLTAAHPSLPFGTKVKVTHKRTGKSCIVEITDRCPRLSQRVIDLSKGAFQEIGASGGIAAVDCIVMAQE